MSKTAKVGDMLSIEELRCSLIFDFEGEGIAIGSDTAPLPHMVGLFYPNKRGTSGKYRWAAFKKDWKPAINGSRKEATNEELGDFFTKKAQELRQRQGKLIHWSSHEAEVLKNHLDRRDFKIIEPVLFNLRIPAKKYIRRIRKTKTSGKSLEDFFAAFYRKRHPFPPLKIGAAESCRRIDSVCGKTRKWRHFTPRQRDYVHSLIAYNEGDCRATWLIAKRLSNSTLFNRSDL